MNERFSLDSTMLDIIENERVNRKLPLFFDMNLCQQVKWPFDKMKLKRAMKMTHFPAQELVDAANFILERREAGDKITIPIWRELSEDVVLIPFLRKGEDMPAVVICGDGEGLYFNKMRDTLAAADILRTAGAAVFILNSRKKEGIDDMARTVRFLRANHKKLHIAPNKIILLAFGEKNQAALELYLHPDNIRDDTHRYDEIKTRPNEIWCVESAEKSFKKGRKTESESVYIISEEEYSSGDNWLEVRLHAFCRFN